ncbi:MULTISPECIES: tetratricopeptide repeat protein [Acidobacterium]|nr:MULTISPECIES: tetratricopeptide repeat protein [Acidobacterium]
MNREMVVSRSFLRAALLAALCILFGTVAYSQETTLKSGARTAYTKKIQATYNYRFGVNHPFAPGNPVLAGGGFIQPGAFPTAQYCAHCHQAAYHQWRQSLHSNSFRDPFYRTSVNILIRTKGIEYARHCDSCHNPIAVLSGALTEDSQVDRSFDGDGVTCMVCHSIQSVNSTKGNGSYVMGIPAVMTDAKGNRIPGEVPYQEILDHTDRHVRAVMQGLYLTPQFCSACHKANLPAPLNRFKFINAFSTYDDWQQSKFSRQSPLNFYHTQRVTTCQDCHMPRVPIKRPDYGAKNGMLASHRWLAGNTAVPFYYGYREQLDKTIEFLKSGQYLNVDIFGIKKLHQPGLIGPLGSVPFHLEAGDVLDAYVVIQSKNIGHSFIPEIRDLYQAWVEFTVRDAKGHTLCRSGYLRPDGTLDPWAHSFTNRPVDDDGKRVNNHEVWRIHSVAFDNTIQAGRSALIRYRFQIPVNVKGPITVTARVNYRHFREVYINHVLGQQHPAYPVVTLASCTRTLVLGENHPVTSRPGENPDWMRWNNLGIAYLSELQYAAAVKAFDHVVQLRPDYADAYTNIAVVEIPWEKYGSAMDSIRRALMLSPHDARAHYYAALLERRAGHPQQEVADLLEAEKQYPQSRDVRRELGVAYYRLGEDKLAIEQFEALEKIDPDDLAAHYNLAILYHRAGMATQARAEQALFVTEKVNSTARSLSFMYLQSHPEESLESIPWHLHNLLPGNEGETASGREHTPMTKEAQ